MPQPHRVRRPRPRLRWLGGAALVAAGLALWQAPHVPLLVLAAILVALLVDGLSDLLRKALPDAVSRGWTRAVAVLAFAGLTAGLFGFLGPRVSDQADRIAERLPAALDRFEHELSNFGLGRALLHETPSADEVKEVLDLPGGDQAAAAEAEPPSAPAPAPDAQQEPESAGAVDLGALFSSTFGVLLDLLIVLVLGGYLVANPSAYRRGVILLFTPERREEARATLDELETLLKRWLAGRVISMAVVAAATGLGLALLGLPFALTLGVIAGLLSFIPNVGPLIGAAPGVLLGLLDGGVGLALGAAAVYTGVQLVESYALTPQIDKRAVRIAPGLLLLAQLLAGLLFGALGLLLATPLVVIVVTGVRRIYLEGVLGGEDWTEEPEDEPDTGHTSAEETGSLGQAQSASA